MSAPGTPHVRTLVCEALRTELRKALRMAPRAVGGWEIIPGREPSLAVYIHEGDFEFKPGGLVASQDNLIATMHLRSGSQPMAEDELNTLADAIALVINQFHHPAVAGCKASGWSFDIRGDNTFDNLLTIRGKVTLRTRGQPAPNETLLFRAAQVVLESVQQEE